MVHCEVSAWINSELQHEIMQWSRGVTAQQRHFSDLFQYLNAEIESRQRVNVRQAVAMVTRNCVISQLSSLRFITFIYVQKGNI
jgi:hypothetical protein